MLIESDVVNAEWPREGHHRERGNLGEETVAHRVDELRNIGLAKVVAFGTISPSLASTETAIVLALSARGLYGVSCGTSEIRNRDKMPKSLRCGSKSPVSGAARNANWAQQTRISDEFRGESLQLETVWRMTQSDAKCSPRQIP